MRRREKILTDIVAVARDLSILNLIKLLWCAQGFQQIEKEDRTVTK